MKSLFLCSVAWGGAFLFLLIDDPVFHLTSSAGVQDLSPGQSVSRVPEGVILVKGASPSASGSETPLPEDAQIENGVFTAPYFQMSFRLPKGWTEEYKGPPPSENGRYVLAELTPVKSAGEHSTGSILITAEDMFFVPLPVGSARDVINYAKGHLQPDYVVEHLPEQIQLGGRQFSTFAFGSRSARLHWRVLATQVRCHTIEIVLTSRDTNFIDSVLNELGTMTLPGEVRPDGAGAIPICIKDYVRDGNLLSRIDPLLTEHRFDPVPVRIIIDRSGTIRHIHFLSAFPDQVRAITDALAHWKFKPYTVNGQPLEVETGILFGSLR